MGQVVVSIAGRSFRLACDDGDEDRVADLARQFDATVDELRQSFGEVGDTRLAVMAGLVMGDKVAEADAKIKQLEDQIAALQQSLSAHQVAETGSADAVRAKLDDFSDRLERLNQDRAGG